MKALNGGDEILDLNRIMKYCLTPIPYCIATADGYLAKGDKSKSFSNLSKTIEDAVLKHTNSFTVEDGNALFYQLKPVPDTFKRISEKIYDNLPRGDVLVSTDMYWENSIKTLERQRRGCGERFIVKGENTRKPYDWKSFLSNSENKEQLIEMIFKVWSSVEFSAKLNDRKFIMIKHGEAFELTTGGNQIIPCLTSNQEETDSRVVLYVAFAAEQGYDQVRIRTPDSDIFWILLHHARSIDIQIIYDTGSGNNKRLINISSLCDHYSPSVCNALLGIHGFTGCDSTSFFKGKGKVRPMKLALKSPLFCSTFAKLGESWDITDEHISGLENLYVYCMVV